MQSTYEASPTSRTGQFDEATEKVKDAAQQISKRAGEVADDAVETAKQHPYTTIAIAAGLAFAVGALWKMNSRPRSQLDQLLARMPDVPSASTLRSYWR